MQRSTIMVEVMRGGHLESLHRGMVAAVDSAGQLIKRQGDENFVTFLRSSAKPFQAIPLVESGAVERFALSDQELAVIAGSHSGEEMHTRTVANILRKIGLGPEHLLCGAHYPLHRQTTERMMRSGETPIPLHNNCSGKHAGMLALATQMGASIDDYYTPEHPVQRLMLKVLAEFAGLEPGDVITGTDGCGVPTFAIPLWRTAYAFARLVDPRGLSEKRQAACRTIVRAMRAHPEMIGGTSNRLDTDLMRLKGNLVAKSGAEAHFAIGIATEKDRGLGIALKVEDGSARGCDPAVVEILHQLGFLDEQELGRLVEYSCPQVVNCRGEIVGEVRPCLHLRA